MRQCCFVRTDTAQGEPDPVLTRVSKNGIQMCAPSLGGAQTQKQCPGNSSSVMLNPPDTSALPTSLLAAVMSQVFESPALEHVLRG